MREHESKISMEHEARRQTVPCRTRDAGSRSRARWIALPNVCMVAPTG